MVLLAPKCHAELAGEGVKYVWAYAKGAYRNMSLQQKKGKDNFKASACSCLLEEVITTVRIRKICKASSTIWRITQSIYIKWTNKRTTIAQRMVQCH